MDPTVCYREMREAFLADVEDDRMDEAKEHADTLNAWLRTCGFTPHITGDTIKDRRTAYNHIAEVRKYIAS